MQREFGNQNYHIFLRDLRDKSTSHGIHVSLRIYGGAGTEESIQPQWYYQ